MNFHPVQVRWHVVRFGPPGHGVGVGPPFLGLLFFLVIVALVVWALVAVSRHHHHGEGAARPAASATSDALKILNERFARGEIDVEDFTRRRDLLLQTP